MQLAASFIDTRLNSVVARRQRVAREAQLAAMLEEELVRGACFPVATTILAWVVVVVGTRRSRRLIRPGLAFVAGLERLWRELGNDQ